MTLPLTMPERIHLLQEWILPLMIYPARAYFPTEDVCTKLANVYRVTLRLSSWGLTLPIRRCPRSWGELTSRSLACTWCGSTPRILCCPNTTRVNSPPSPLSISMGGPKVSGYRQNWEICPGSSWARSPGTHTHSWAHQPKPTPSVGSWPRSSPQHRPSTAAELLALCAFQGHQ